MGSYLWVLISSLNRVSSSLPKLASWQARLQWGRRLGQVWESERARQVVVVGGVCTGCPPTLPFRILCPDAFEIRRLSSVFLRVRTNVGVRVLYDREGLRLYLQVDQRWVEDTVGLCGTFNGNTQDDFLYVALPWNRKKRGNGPLRAGYLEALLKCLSHGPSLCPACTISYLFLYIYV